MKQLLVTFALLASASIALAQQPAPAAAAAPLAPAAAPAAAPATTPVDPNMVVLEVGSAKMTAAQFNLFVDALPAQIQTMARGPGKRMLADKLVEIELLAGEARKQGLDQEPKIAMALKLAQDQTLAQAMAEKASKPDETSLKAEFDKDPTKYDQLKVRHILIRTADSPVPAAPGKKDLSPDDAKAKATDLRNRIVNKKEDFAAIAKAESDDTQSGMAGGELGMVVDQNSQLVPEFKDAAFALKAGDVSQPVKSQYGYHLIQVEERKTPKFEDVKDQMGGNQGGTKVEALVKKLKETETVKIDDSFFGKPSAKPAGHP